jgi:putative endonuclease
MVRGESRSARGKRAEDRAAAHLRAQGYRIVERNFRCRAGELDIVARDGDTLVFVEVRSRARGHRGDALETVTRAKQTQLIRVARVYLAMQRPAFRSCRFDVVGITAGAITLIRDAFRADS